MSASFKLDLIAMAKVMSAAVYALEDTGEAVRVDVQQSNTMPFETGELQNRSTFVDASKAEEVLIVSDTPYARRLYFHPEYNFNKEHNSNAGGKWFEPYINGEKKDYPQKVFAREMKKRMGGI